MRKAGKKNKKHNEIQAVTKKWKLATENSS